MPGIPSVLREEPLSLNDAGRQITRRLPKLVCCLRRICLHRRLRLLRKGHRGKGQLHQKPCRERTSRERTAVCVLLNGICPIPGLAPKNGASETQFDHWIRTRIRNRLPVSLV